MSLQLKVPLFSGFVALCAAIALAPAYAGPATSEFAGKRNLPIAYQVASTPSEHGRIVILTGYMQSLLQYQELVADFQSAGFSVYIMDHRGMGLSGRILPNRQIIHVTEFSDYVDDAEKFVTEIAAIGAKGTPLLLFAHSTGALIGAELLARRPGIFARAVLSAPLFALNTDPWPRSVAYALTWLATKLGFGEEYAPGYEDFSLDHYTLAYDETTHSAERYAEKRSILEANPNIRMGGPSSHWVRLTLEETEKVEALAPMVKEPVLLLQPGEDHYVYPEAQAAFCKLVTHCSIKTFPGAYHEIMREIDDYRKPALAATVAFFLGR